MKMYTSELDHMTKMAATPIYGKKKNNFKIFFSKTDRAKLVCSMESYEDFDLKLVYTLVLMSAKILRVPKVKKLFDL